VENQDFQIRRNLSEFPRAWVVHDARWLNPISALSGDGRPDAMQEMLYADDPLWHDTRLRAFDPHTLAWIDSDKAAELEPFLSGRPPRPTETVKVTYPTPVRTELEASLESPGLVILADVYYPGWKLSIDGTPAPIYRVNRLMRGAAVPEGTHRLLYTYAPRSFRAGRVVSNLGLALLAVLGVACAWRPTDPVLAARQEVIT
jgi:hypothetical protein